jgi:hypothetical protein
LNFRRTLLAAVENFLEASPTSLAKAHRLVARAYRARRSFTLDDIAWGGVISALTDSVFYDDSKTLRDYHSMLRGSSSEIHRTYLNHDFGRALTAEERFWLTELNDMLGFLSGFPFPDHDAALLEYDQRADIIKQAMLISPPPDRPEDETIYHLILRESSMIVTHVHLKYSLLRSTYLVPSHPYSSYPPQPKDGRDNTPDVSADLDWARRALRSIVEQGWLLITWQITPEHYRISIH